MVRMLKLLIGRVTTFLQSSHRKHTKHVITQHTISGLYYISTSRKRSSCSCMFLKRNIPSNVFSIGTLPIKLNHYKAYFSNISSDICSGGSYGATADSDGNLYYVSRRGGFFKYNTANHQVANASFLPVQHI